MLKKAFGKVFAHKWRLDAERMNPSRGISLHSYYSCLKTGDRKVVTRSGPGWGYQPVDKIWLQSGSGVYYINGRKVDTVAEPALRASWPPRPPAALTRQAGAAEKTAEKPPRPVAAEKQQRLRALRRQTPGGLS